MRKKTIKIDKDIWDQLENLQKLLNKNDQQDISLEDLLRISLLHFEEAFIKKSKPKPKRKKLGVPDRPKMVKSDIPTDLAIPPIPKKKPIKLDVNQTELAELTKKETEEIKFILIECQICGSKPISMPVPKDKILKSDQPVVDISYVHGNPEHVIVAQLDHDFQVRRRRASWVLFEKDFV
jgi:hypothetical protein